MQTNYQLQQQNGKLTLHDSENPNDKPLSIDFLSNKANYRRQHGGGHKQLIAKAVGIKPHKNLHIIDATAGLGEDAFVLACLGCQMTLLERSPYLAALLADAIERGIAAADPACKQMQLQQCQAHDYLQNLTEKKLS